MHVEWVTFVHFGQKAKKKNPNKDKPKKSNKKKSNKHQTMVLPTMAAARKGAKVASSNNIKSVQKSKFCLLSNQLASEQDCRFAVAIFQGKETNFFLSSKKNPVFFVKKNVQIIILNHFILVFQF